MINKKLLLLIFLIPLICGCVSQNEPSGPEQLKVVTTILPYEELIKSVGGDRVSVSVMVPPGAEPHTFEPTPSQIRQIADADIYVENGAGLESWLESVINVNRHMLVVDSSRGIDLIRGTDQENSGEMQGVDPHTWVSLRNGEVIVRNICDGLIQADPSNRDYYLKNRDDYLTKMRAADAGLNSTFAGTVRKNFVVLHPDWSYFARDYGLTEIAINAEEKEPGPRYITEVIDTARKNNITTVFAEPEYNPKSAEVIAREINGTVVVLDPLAENYLENMQHMGMKIAQTLKT
ncbi:MAG TPA: zinc ABC transporter substrate-binding protein [Methanotrichaceae archaeon]|nr:zinc ABC transporter substrate-binding protein [Methanotrichaceae archaeon]